MAPSDWFYAKGNRQLGPVSSTELKQLAESGQLTADDLVWSEGMVEWIPADKVKGLFEAPVEVEFSPTQTPSADAELSEFAQTPAETQSYAPRKHVLDMLIELIQGQFPAEFVESSSRILTVCGHWGLYVGMAMLLVFGIVIGPTVGSLPLALAMSAAGILVLIVLQYASGKFLAALDMLNRNTPGRISSKALPDCFALLTMCAGIALLVVLVIVALPLRSFSVGSFSIGSVSIVFFAIGVFILCEYAAILSLTLEALNIEVGSGASASAEAVGILTFLAKLLLRLVPVAFGVGVALGICHLIVTGASVASGPKSETVETIQLVTAMLTSGNALFIFAALPIAAYVLFLVAHLFIDVLHSILKLPRLLEKDDNEDKQKGNLKV